MESFKVFQFTFFWYKWTVYHVFYFLVAAYYFVQRTQKKSTQKKADINNEENYAIRTDE